MGSLEQRKGAEQLGPESWVKRYGDARRQIDGDRRSWKVRRIDMADTYSGPERRSNEGSNEERRMTLFRRRKTDRRKSPFI